MVTSTAKFKIILYILVSVSTEAQIQYKQKPTPDSNASNRIQGACTTDVNLKQFFFPATDNLA